jgi:hypothetical protein
MALFGRERLPARSTLSRFLAALPPEPVEALRALFLSDLLARPLVPENEPAGLWDRTGNQWLVFDIDGTREAARQRALPKTPELPPPQRRLRPLCAPGYTGRKRGEVVRSRTTILQAHTHQWLGSFSGAGNGKAWEELRRAVPQIQHYLTTYQLPAERVLVRLDGLSGMGATLSDPGRDCRLSCAAKTLSCFCELRSSFGSPFLLINSSAVRKVLSCGHSMTAHK